MIYLNNAATSFPKPESVIEAVNNYNRGLPFHSLRSGSVNHQTDFVLELRENLRRLFNADSPDQIVLTSGATHSLNLIIRGLLKENDHVITTWTEHNSVLRLLKTLEQQRFISLSLVECDEFGRVDPENIKANLSEKTRAVIVNHCSNVTGTVQNLGQIGRLILNHKAFFIVDGAQSAGSLDINVKDAFIDALAFTGHKALFGMQGTGGLYIGDNIDPDPLIIGGTGVKSDYLFQPPGKPQYYEAGSPNMPGIVSLNAGVSFVLKEGLPVIQAKKKELKNIVLEELLNMKSIKVYGGNQRQDFINSAEVISFNINGFPPEDTGYILENAFGIICRSGLHCAPLIHKPIGSYPEGSVRVSFSYFNKKKDTESLINAVRKIAGAK